MFKLSEEVECIPLGNESPRVVRLPEELKHLQIILVIDENQKMSSPIDPHPVRVRQGALVILTAELGVGPHRQHVDVVRHDGRGPVEVLHRGPGAFDLM